MFCSSSSAAIMSYIPLDPVWIFTFNGVERKLFSVSFSFQNEILRDCAVIKRHYSAFLSLSLSLRTIAMFSQILLLNLNRWLTEWHNKTWWRIETTNHSNTHKEVPRTEIHVQELFTLEKIDEKKVELRAVVVVGRLYTIVARLMCASWARPSFTWCKSIKNFENDWK